MDLRAGAHDTIDENSMVGVAAVDPSQAHGQGEFRAGSRRSLLDDAAAPRVITSQIVTLSCRSTTLRFGCPTGTEDARTRAAAGHVSRSARLDA